MDKYRKFVEVLRKGVAEGKQLPVMVAEVVSVQEESCTVKLGGDLELEDVRLKATINGNTDYLILKPKPGSKVLIGSLSGDLKDLCVLKADEVTHIDYKENGLELHLDSEQKKLQLKNETVSLKEIFEDLKSTLDNFMVLTSQGPSAGLDPLTIADLIAFETKFKQLLY